MDRTNGITRKSSSTTFTIIPIIVSFLSYSRPAYRVVSSCLVNTILYRSVCNRVLKTSVVTYVRIMVCEGGNFLRK